ncbi:MAG: (2Fe-2S)-binding protein [Candidatus Muiribacteriota bacterium]
MLIHIKFRVNNRDYDLKTNANKRLVDVLREDLKLTGTKEGCGIGECGACTVIMDKKAVNSCLILAGQLDGKTIETVEGLEKNGEISSLQKNFLEAGAVQCGYCTPGMLMSIKALLYENPNPGEEEIKEAISGNICRCTGYKQIIDAVKLETNKN